MAWTSASPRTRFATTISSASAAAAATRTPTSIDLTLGSTTTSTTSAFPPRTIAPTPASMSQTTVLRSPSTPASSCWGVIQ